MLKSPFGPRCMQCKDGCQGVTEGVAKVPIRKTRLRLEKDPPAGVATKNSVHKESIEVAGSKQTRKEESNW